MVSTELSPRLRELIRQGAWIGLNPSPEWLDAFDRATCAVHPALAEDPALANTVSRSNRTNLYRFTVAHLRDPGMPVAANYGGEPLRMARELVQRGLDISARDIYRVGVNMALRRWTDIAFDLTSDRSELHELLDVISRSADDYVDATLAAVAEELDSEPRKLTGNLKDERRKLVERILAGGPVNAKRAQARLAYPLDRFHTAAILWDAHADRDESELDVAADAFGNAVGCPQPLTVAPNTGTRWLWVKDVAAFDTDRVHRVFESTPHLRIAIGTSAHGIDGFRRSHQEALNTQHMLVRLRSHQPVAFFDAVQMVALLTENCERTDDFIKSTLGDFASASPVLQHTLLTYINERCHAVRAAHRLYIHRNTLLYRLESAQRLLPQPLDDTLVRVAVALEILRWRGHQTQPSEQHHREALAAP